jgi:hypothetical protein
MESKEFKNRMNDETSHPIAEANNYYQKYYKNNNHPESKIRLQKNHITNKKDLPDLRIIISLVLVIGIFMFVAAIYYGIINP